MLCEDNDWPEAQQYSLISFGYFNFKRCLFIFIDKQTQAKKCQIDNNNNKTNSY
jgi:hypothetical protein